LSEPPKLRDIVVLGLLKMQPRYGYEIKMIIDHVMAHIIDISSGSLYYGIKKLQQQKYIEETSVERVGRRPERSIYKITDKGRALLSKQLPEVIFPYARAFFPLNLALYFFSEIPEQERVRRLVMWKERLKMTSHFVEKLKSEYGEDADHWHLRILDHQRKYYKMEEQFINELLREHGDQGSYKLTAEDKLEIEHQMEHLKSHFDYNTYIGMANSDSD